ncbi:MAG: hypothetical protein ACI8QF_003999 [Limisphaerales bacterium]|jgi:hypothetical protein
MSEFEAYVIFRGQLHLSSEWGWFSWNPLRPRYVREGPRNCLR